MGKHIGWSQMERAWLRSLAPWLSCREIARDTGVSIQTAANLRRFAKEFQHRWPKLQLCRIRLVEARAIRKKH
jgi:hypothetical protein